MVTGFYGHYEHTLDGKGRIILPARFRPHFAGGGFLTKYFEGCLALWTPDVFAARMEAMRARAESGRTGRNLSRAWSAGSYEVQIDESQGRLQVPSDLRSWARLESEVHVIGNIDRVELWSPAVWEENVAPDAEQLFGREGGDIEEIL